MFLWYIILFTIFEKSLAISQDDFICVDGTIIDIKKICNGFANCPDASDETKELCYHSICPKNMFRCYYGACIPQNLKCDGKNNCHDNSDESQCGKSQNSCEWNEFRCKSHSCIPISELCDGIDNCPDGSDETKDICEELPCPENSFRCQKGGCVDLESRCDGQQNCLDNSDESKVLCESLKCEGHDCIKLRHSVHCPAIDISRVDAKCQSPRDGIVPCDNPVPAGTKVKYECKPYFTPYGLMHQDNRHAECQLDGVWSRDILQCEPECGLMRTDPIALVVKGWDTNKVVYPWHAQMYVQENEKWEAWCGGTLITERAVLSAGHCVWEVDPKNIKLAFAKYYSDFNKTDVDTQIINVKRIMTQTLYQDRNGNYGSDLTILELEHPVTLTSLVHPACLDWNLKDVERHLSEGSTGLVVGMGLTEDEEFSPILKGTFLPVVENTKCLSNQVHDFKKYITYTVFCAGWNNGTGVCNGDSGGGLLFPKSGNKNQWVLQGLVSVSPRKLGTSHCDPDHYTIFTKVSAYLGWIRNVLRKIHPL